MTRWSVPNHIQGLRKWINLKCPVFFSLILMNPELIAHSCLFNNIEHSFFWYIHINSKQAYIWCTRTCDTCDSEFGNYNELKTHICQKTFKHLGNLIQHMTTHYGEKNFQCNLCDKYFTTGAVLKQHKTTHLEIKAFKCDDDKSFKCKTNYKRHLKSSHEARKFSCDFCEKLIGDTSILNRHISDVHRPRTCDTCDAEFEN